MLTLESIHIYPVKGLAGVSVTQSHVEKRGLALDRRWMVVDEEGVFLSQRKFGKMATIRLAIYKECLSVSHSNHGEIQIPIREEGPVKTVQVWKSKVEALEYGPEINSWFSEVLGFRCSLVRMPESTLRATHPDYSEPGDIVSFADGFPVTVATLSSLAELNTRLEQSIPMNRFRPNLVISGPASPWEEDGWRRIRLGNAVLRAVKPCGRCVVTTIDQETGVSESAEPLTTLAKIRKSANSVDFSVNLIPENEETIQIGQELEIIERVE